MGTNTNAATATNTAAITATLWAAVAGFTRPDAITGWNVRNAPATNGALAIVDVSGPVHQQQPDDVDDFIANVRWVLNTHTDVRAGCRWYAIDSSDARRITIRFVCLTDEIAAEEGFYPW